MVTNRTPIKRADRWRYEPWKCDDDERPYPRERWQRYRDKIMQHEAGRDRRPPEWWLYERGIEPPDHEAMALYDMDELQPDELQELLAHWREQYDWMHDPHFAYCIGHAKPGDTFASWVHGAEARRLHIAWAGIPSSLIAKWDAEKLDEKRKTRR
jgi:hypothetical protein